jgi:tetratricopeptide (TPR) repeat protein
VSRKLITEDKLEEAVSVIEKVDTPFRNFRSGLIYQRLGIHTKACDAFQRELRANPQNITALKALGHSYAILNRAMSAKSVALALRAAGSPDLELEWHLSAILNQDIVPAGDSSFDIDRTPLPFFHFMRRTTARLQDFRELFRQETAHDLIATVSRILPDFTARWGSLPPVLKACGDFFLESFLLTDSPGDLTTAVDFYKRRAESFLDLARVFELSGRYGSSACAQNLPRSLPTLAWPRHCLCALRAAGLRAALPLRGREACG